MLDLKAELNDLGIPFEPIGWVKAPSYPYGIFTDEVTVRGSDLPSAAKVITHNVNIEVYHKEYDQLLIARDKIAEWADSRALTYRLRTLYMGDEDHYCVTLASTFTEKKGMIKHGSE